MSKNNIIKFRDDKTGELKELDLASGIMLTHGSDGRTVEAQMERGDKAVEMSLARYAHDFERSQAMRAWDGGTHNMDLGIGDVHQQTPLPNYAQGYRNVDGVCDIVSPVVPTSKPSAKFYEWSSDDAFQQVDNTESAPGAQVAEISPRLSLKNFATTEYALGAFVPTEIEAAADSPLQPMQAAVRRVMQALAIGREKRVFAMISNTASYPASLLVDLTLDPTKKWNGGVNADPLKDIHTIMENAYMEPTDIILSRKVQNTFARNTQIREYVKYKSSVKTQPTAQDWSAILELPPFQVAKMKAKSKSTGLIDYIWGNDVILIRRPQGMPSDGQDVGSSYTFRWQGGGVSDGSMSGGLLVRTFFDQKRGPRGGMSVVVTHQDAEVLTSGYVGGIIKGAIQ